MRVCPFFGIIALCAASRRRAKGLKRLNILEQMNLNLHALVIFRNVLNDKVMAKAIGLLSVSAGAPLAQAAAYSAFAAALFQENENLTDYLLNLILQDENVYALRRAQNRPISGVLEETLLNELKALEAFSRLTAAQVRAFMEFDGYLPIWQTRDVDFTAAYRKRMEGISTYGYGVFSKYSMFTAADGAIEPVLLPDPIRLSDLKGYESERQAVIDNTLALLSGKPAANVLLYGDAGTGKSSCVKAIANEYADCGLRLIEVPQKQVCRIPRIIERIYENPLKFILFIDDLSFAGDNDDFTALKAMLEGSVSAKAPNLAVYATSNRRRLLKETFSARSGDDIHESETIQEMGSLSERFGLSVGFFKPGRDLYLEIVHALRERYGIRMDPPNLNAQAERYALSRGGRSPRVARQFMEHVKRMEE